MGSTSPAELHGVPDERPLRCALPGWVCLLESADGGWGAVPDAWWCVAAGEGCCGASAAGV